MAFTRFKDDPARVTKYLQETTSIGKYHLNTPGNGLNNPYIDDSHIILQKWGANLQSNSLLVENELRNLNRPLSRDLNAYKRVDSQTYQYPVKNFDIDEKLNKLKLNNIYQKLKLMKNKYFKFHNKNNFVNRLKKICE